MQFQQSKHPLREAAIMATAELDLRWGRHVDDNLHTCIKYLLYGKYAVVSAAQALQAQNWLLHDWALKYFRGMGIKFYARPNDEFSLEDSKTVEAHLKSEFAQLKTEDIGDAGVPWRTWWVLHKERYPHLIHIAFVLLSLVPTEAAVERSFSKQGIIHSDRRNRSSDDLVEAQMMIS